VLDALVRIIGEGLRLDRCLILDIDATDDLAKGLSEWLSDANGEAFSVKHDYPLDLFRRSHDYMWMRRCAIVSHLDEVHPCLSGEGSAPLVHGREGGQHHVKSLIWHPFCFRPDGYFLLVANLTEQRRAWAPEEIAFIEAAANQVNLALQKLRILGERVQVEERLRQSQKMEAIGRLAGGIAHDFNNLLTAIIGYADLLRQQVPDDHPLRRHVDGILQVTDRAAATTRQLLSFSRRQVIRARNLDLNDLVDELQRLLRRLIGETIILDVQVADEPLRVRVDPGQLELALVNLAVNARDAMPRGGRLTLATSVYRVDDAAARRLGVPAGDMAAIRVADTGVGMDQDTISSNPSSPPRRWARAPASVCRASTASSPRPAERSPSIRSRDEVRPSPFCCPSRMRRKPPLRRARFRALRHRSSRAPRRPWCWPRTTRFCANCWEMR